MRHVEAILNDILTKQLLELLMNARVHCLGKIQRDCATLRDVFLQMNRAVFS